MKRKGTMVLTHERPPAFPSRWCRWTGHSWTVTTTRRGGRIEEQWKVCNECGAEESWDRFDSSEGREALEADAEAPREEGR